MQLTTTFLVAALALLDGSVAAPVANTEPVIRSPFFRLSAVTDQGTGFNGAALTSYHTGPGTNWAILKQGVEPRTAYLNGTEAQLNSYSGSLIFPFDHGEEALILPQPSTGKPLRINAETGSIGLFLNGQQELKINSRPQRAFYGCTLPNDKDYAQLFVQYDANPTPKTCFPVGLKATF